MARVSKRVKKLLPHSLLLILGLGVIAWLIWLTLRETKEGMTNDDEFVNASDLIGRLVSPLTADQQERLARGRGLSDEQKACTIKVVNENMDSLLAAPALIRKGAGIDHQHIPFLNTLEKTCLYK